MKLFDLFRRKKESEQNALACVPYQTEYYQLMRYCDVCEDYYPDYNKKSKVISLKKIGEQCIMTMVYECPVCGEKTDPKDFAITEDRYNQILKEYKTSGGSK